MKPNLFTSQWFRQVLLLILLMLAIFFASTGGFQSPRWDELLKNIAISVLSAVVSIYFLQGIERRNEIDTNEIARRIQDNLNPINQSHFVRADRNMDMGDKYWIDLVNQLSTTVEPVAFTGSRLSWWLKTRTYKEPLRVKFMERLRLAAERYERLGADSKCMTYILLSNPTWVPKWKEFFQDIIEQLVSVEPKKKNLQELYWGKIVIGVLPKDAVRYSLILCGDRLAVTHYTSTGRSEDSPTLEIHRGSIIRNLYLDDLEILKTKILPSEEGAIETNQPNQQPEET